MVCKSERERERGKKIHPEAAVEIIMRGEEDGKVTSANVVNSGISRTTSKNVWKASSRLRGSLSPSMHLTNAKTKSDFKLLMAICVAYNIHMCGTRHHHIPKACDVRHNAVCTYVWVGSNENILPICLFNLPSVNL